MVFVSCGKSMHYFKKESLFKKQYLENSISTSLIVIINLYHLSCKKSSQTGLKKDLNVVSKTLQISEDRGNTSRGSQGRTM